MKREAQRQLDRRISMTLMTVTCLLALLHVTGAAHAADLDLKIDSHKAAADEYFEITVTYAGEDSLQVVPPSMDDFTVEQPVHRCGTSIQCINTDCKTEKNCTLVYYFHPRKKGSFTIPPFKLEGPGPQGKSRELARSKSLTVTVTAAGSGRKRQARRGGRGSSGQRIPGNRNIGSKQRRQARVPVDNKTVYDTHDLSSLERFGGFDLFVVPILKKPWGFVNEPFVVDFVLFVNSQGDSPVQEVDIRQTAMELEDVVGFRKEEVDASGQQARITIKGRDYASVVLQRFIYTPMAPGTASLPGGKAKVGSIVQVMDPFWGPMRRRQQVGLTIPAVQMEIRDLPPDRPAGFDTGNIGRFAIKALEAPAEQPAGSWMMVKYTIEGEGNLFSVVPPVFEAMPGLALRPPHVDRSEVVKDQEGLSGLLKVQIPIRIDRPGRHDLPELRLVWFDPATEQFGTTRARLPTLTTTRPTGADGLSSLPASEELEGIITDADLPAPPDSEGFFQLSWMLVWALALPGLWLVCLVSLGAWRFFTRDSSRRRSRLAFVGARQALSVARKAVESRDAGGFFPAATKALTLAVDGGFGISTGSSTLDEVQVALSKAGIPPDLNARLREELENVEFSRFAPSAVKTEDLAATLARCQELVRDLEKVPPGGARPANGPGRYTLGGLVVFVLATATVAGLSASTRAPTPSPADLYAQANQAAFEGDYGQARDDYQALLAALKNDHPAILFNLGNCAYKLGQLGLATYYFRVTAGTRGEIGRRAVANLELTRTTLLEKYKNKIEKGVVRYDESHGLWFALLNLVGTGVSGSLFLLFSALVFSGMFLWTFSRKSSAAFAGRLLVLSFLAPMLVAAALYFGAEATRHSYRFGIVVTGDARILDAPSLDAPGDLLPEGLEVRVLMHNEAGYFKVKLSDGKVGYAPDSDVWPLQP